MTMSGSGHSKSVLGAAELWLAQDPDPHDREALLSLIRSGDQAAIVELADAFSQRIAFGTAGLRARMGPGPNRMNTLVVRQAARGIAEQLRSQRQPGRPEAQRVVIGFDARYRSREMAQGAAEVLLAEGFEVIISQGPIPTPLLAFSVRGLHCAAGLMVTASHNPKDDNGLKVYWGDGAQIIPPNDIEIARHIEIAAQAGNPVGADLSEARELGSEVVEQYLATLPVRRPGAELNIAHTSLHGVGNQLFGLALRHSGFAATPVRSQMEPDPDFPTVVFPNPEEPGALDALLELAQNIHADIAIANDPDADRFCAAAPTESGFSQLSGDQVGALLAHWLLVSESNPQETLVTNTVVSSRLAAAVAKGFGAQHFETLTGFKWLCRPAIAHPELRQVLCYEEALGYAIGPSARDKDGIATAMHFCSMVAELKEASKTVWNLLDEIESKHGAHVQHNLSLRVPNSIDEMATAVDELAGAGLRELANTPIEQIERPASDVLRLFLNDQTRVVIRPSGTEPKIKIYCEAIVRLSADSNLQTARQLAKRRASDAAEAAAALVTAALHH